MQASMSVCVCVCVCVQLVAEMRKLGAVIVSANFNQIIIATGKKDLTAAVG